MERHAPLSRSSTRAAPIILGRAFFTVYLGYRDLRGIGRKVRSMREFASRSIAMLAGMSLLVSLSPASAFTPPVVQAAGSSNVETVQYRGWGWGWGWGWGPGAVAGGLVAGAIIGSAIAAPRYYGPAYYGPDYGPCWRRQVDPYGRWFWARVC
jgi:hypothetical protein